MSLADLKAHGDLKPSEIAELRRICYNNCIEVDGHLFYKGVDSQKYAQTSFKLRNTHFHMRKSQLSLFLKLKDSDFDFIGWEDGMATSHLCHKKACIKAEHLTLETNEQNRERDECLRRRSCIGHNNLPSCLV